jgi:hypothetical protein
MYSIELTPSSLMILLSLVLSINFNSARRTVGRLQAYGEPNFALKESDIAGERST